MTVISRKQQNYDYPNSNTASDAESMNLASASASDAESETGEPRAVNRQWQFLRLRVPIFEEFGRLKKSSGKRKQRRLKNRSDLHVLSEEDEDEDFIKLMDDYKSPFARLLEDRNALTYWNEFNDLPEEEQNKLMEFVPNHGIPQAITKSDNPLARISSKIKRAMKIKKNMPMEMIQTMEIELLDFFKGFPGGAFLSTPVTSFERLLLHAIAQYHNLKSISLIGLTVRCVEVSSPPNWAPMEMCFRDFVKTLRQ